MSRAKKDPTAITDLAEMEILVTIITMISKALADLEVVDSAVVDPTVVDLVESSLEVEDPTVDLVANLMETKDKKVADLVAVDLMDLEMADPKMVVMAAGLMEIKDHPTADLVTVKALEMVDPAEEDFNENKLPFL